MLSYQFKNILHNFILMDGMLLFLLFVFIHLKKKYSYCLY